MDKNLQTISFHESGHKKKQKQSSKF